MDWITANIARIALYGIAALAVISAIWIHGYSRGERKLYEYQGKQATARIAVIEKTRVIENALNAKLVADNDKLRRDYQRERMRNESASGQPLSSAAGFIPSCPGTSTGMHDAATVLATVESAVLGILEAGDAEIIKLRRLYERDVELSRIKP